MVLIIADLRHMMHKSVLKLEIYQVNFKTWEKSKPCLFVVQWPMTAFHFMFRCSLVSTIHHRRWNAINLVLTPSQSRIISKYGADRSQKRRNFKVLMIDFSLMKQKSTIKAVLDKNNSSSKRSSLQQQLKCIMFIMQQDKEPSINKS